MSAITIRNLPEATHGALKQRAAEHGRSTEAEVREILGDAARLKGRVKVGSRLAEFGRRYGGLELDTARDSSPTEPASFE